ncbi:hypothetical protein GPJ56_010024 [Histomonas meleagridis]|uniref:uncharacterized protein n=1 Tax=Histomonas meleagridis TaxID=135588 RepID=UPI003559D9A4|nr:hypothetical protein GPJ56_010024 [Histomonas meleagridis]KAH0799501.1 hypothetical protein GO595_007696 [Histomonas meleagridis]
MSLQNFNSPPKKTELTFHLLELNIDSLLKQVAKTKEIVKELETVNDHQKNTRLQKIHEDSQKRLKTYNENYEELKKKDPTNELEEKIKAKLSAIRIEIQEINKRIGPINQRHIELAEKELEEKEEKERLEKIEAMKSAEQLEEEQRAADLEFTKRNVEEIGEIANIVNQITKEVDTTIADQRDTIVKIDKAIDEAKNEMEKGNDNLNAVEEDQKNCTKKLIIIFVVIFVCLVIVILITLHFLKIF